MPAGKDDAQRTTFRPPWVKEGGPNPLPVPPAPWTLKNSRRDSNTSTSSDTANLLAGVQLRKTSIKEPTENGATATKDNTFQRPQLRKVPPKEEVKVDRREKLPPVKLNSVAERQMPAKKPPPQPVKKQESSSSGTYEDSSEEEEEDEELDKATPVTRNAVIRQESMRRLSQTPAPPPMPPPAPKMPNFDNNNKKLMSEQQRERIEQLKKCPKVRPDWTAMLKEIESNKKLNHVQCNDRSQPLLPQTKATEHFVFESEKDNVHNELLKQICFGIKLNRVKTNDRSKPMLEGLRKFRRQMTIEEQIQKSVSMASMPPEEIEGEVDEMDDIDKVRDDLQSTKQMLALELRNKEAQIRENKRLMVRIQNLEAQLDSERASKEPKASDGGALVAPSNDKVVVLLKKEAEQARKSAEEVERKFTEVSEQLGTAKFELEEAKRANCALEKKLQEAVVGKRSSISQGQAVNGGDESGDEALDEVESEESDGEDNEEKRERRVQRELKQARNKLRNFKNKEDNARKERVALREILKKHQVAIKEEKKKFKSLQKEVDKMAALMKDADEEEEEEEEEEDVDEEESSSEESESEESDSDSERSQSEAEDAPVDKKKANLSSRSERHEKILGALKKGNFLLKTNAERLQDDLNKQKELTANLQEDLDSVLAELG